MKAEISKLPETKNFKVTLAPEYLDVLKSMSAEMIARCWNQQVEPTDMDKTIVANEHNYILAELGVLRAVVERLEDYSLDTDTVSTNTILSFAGTGISAENAETHLRQRSESGEVARELAATLRGLIDIEQDVSDLYADPDEWLGQQRA